MTMGYFDIDRSYFVGAINLSAATFLAAGMGLLMVLQIKAYELNVSYSFSWRFILYDPFATRLIGLVGFAFIANVLSAVIFMSKLFSHPIENNGMVFSMTSILWIALYLGVDYAFEAPAIFPLILLIATLIVLISQQIVRIRMKVLLIFLSSIVFIVPLIGRLTDDKAQESLPQRQVILK